MKIPNKADITLNLNFNIDSWLTDDDKQSILESSKIQDDINNCIKNIISDYIDSYFKFDQINIKFYD